MGAQVTRVRSSYKYNLAARPGSWLTLSFREKFSKEFKINPYCKPTQVDWSSRPRHTGHDVFKELGKKAERKLFDMLCLN